MQPSASQIPSKHLCKSKMYRKHFYYALYKNLPGLTGCPFSTCKSMHVIYIGMFIMIHLPQVNFLCQEAEFEEQSGHTQPKKLHCISEHASLHILQGFVMLSYDINLSENTSLPLRLEMKLKRFLY